MPRPTRVSTTFGTQVREARERKGWTQVRLVAELEKLGEPMDRATLVRIEAGKRGVLIDELMLFALALGVAPLYLLFPRAIAAVELAPGVTVGGWEALLWARGMYALEFTEAVDTEAARQSDEVRFYYDSCTDYEAAATRRFPLVRWLWFEAGLAMSYAADENGDVHLLPTLRSILDHAALAISMLEHKEEK